MPATIQRGLFDKDYSPSTGRVRCVDETDVYVCPNCDDEVDPDNCSENPDGVLWCDECISDACMLCEYCDELMFVDDSVQITSYTGRWPRTESTKYACESCADSHSTKCDDCGNRVSHDHSYTTHDDRDICDSCYEDGYSSCEDCGDIFRHDEMSSSDCGCYCEGCRPYGDDFGPNGFRNRSGSITEIGSARCYGVEVETDECDGYYDLGSSDAWGAKDDCTVSGKEFYSDILNGDDGLDAIRGLARLADSNGWRAGSNCGLHLHLDMSNENDDSKFAVAYAYRATEAVWLRFVDEHRAHGSYSHTIRWNCADIINASERGTFYNWACRLGRYNWANCAAFTDHETIEIRSHQGTCDETEVINWVKAHTRFADWAATKGLDGVKEALAGMDDRDCFKLIASEAWQDDELRDYYNERARRLHGSGF